MSEKDPVWQEIQEYRRKGVSLAELWQFILASTQRQEAWLRHMSRSTLDFKMWQFLMVPERITHLEFWERSHCTTDFTTTHWEEIVRFLLMPKQLHREALKYIAEIASTHPDAIRFLIQSLRDDDLGIRIKTLEILRKTGPSATDAVPFLIQALRDSNLEISQRASLALMEIGGESIETALSQKSDSMNETQRRHAIQILGQIQASHSTPLLIQYLLHDDSPKVRSAAAWALGKIGLNNEFITEALLKGTQDLDDRVRAESAQSLGELSIFSTLPQLLELLQDSANYVQMAAMQSIKMMFLKSPEIARAQLQNHEIPESLKKQINLKVQHRVDA